MKTSILIAFSQLFIPKIVSAEDINIHEHAGRRIEGNRANKQGGGVRVGRNNQGRNNNAASIATTQSEDDDNWWKDDEDELYNPAVAARAQRGRTDGRQKATSVNDMGFGAQSDNSQPNQQPTRQSRNNSSQGIDPNKIARPTRTKQSDPATSDVNMNKVLQSNNVQVVKGPRKKKENKKNKKAMNNQKETRQNDNNIPTYFPTYATYMPTPKDGSGNTNINVNESNGSATTNNGGDFPTYFPTPTTDNGTYKPTYFPTTFMPTGSPTFIGAWGQAYQGPLPKYVYVPGDGGKWVNDGWGNPQWVEDKGYLVPYIAPPTEPPTTFMPTTFPPTIDPNATPSPNTKPTYIPTYFPTTYTPTFSPVWEGDAWGHSPPTWGGVSPPTWTAPAWNTPPDWSTPGWGSGSGISPTWHAPGWHAPGWQAPTWQQANPWQAPAGWQTPKAPPSWQGGSGKPNYSNHHSTASWYRAPQKPVSRWRPWNTYSSASGGGSRSRGAKAGRKLAEQLSIVESGKRRKKKKSRRKRRRISGEEEWQETEE